VSGPGSGGGTTQRSAVDRQNGASRGLALRARAVAGVWSPDQIAGRSRNDFPTIRVATFRGKRFTLDPCPTGQRSQLGPLLATLGACAATCGKIAANCRLASRSKGVRPAVDPGHAMATGRATRWSAGDLWRSRHAGGPKIGYLAVGQGFPTDGRRPFANDQKLFQPLPAALRKTLTLDNGRSSPKHEQLAGRLLLRVYFAKPFVPGSVHERKHQRSGAQFLPKGSDLTHTPVQRFGESPTSSDSRPRKRLGYSNASRNPQFPTSLRLRLDITPNILVVDAAENSSGWSELLGFLNAECSLDPVVFRWGMMASTGTAPILAVRQTLLCEHFHFRGHGSHGGELPVARAATGRPTGPALSPDCAPRDGPRLKTVAEDDVVVGAQSVGDS